jgi:hypothetical protein
MTLRLEAAKLPTFLNRTWVRETLCIVPAISVFALILLNRSPNLLRPLSLSARTGFNLTVLLLFLLVYISFRLQGWAGKALSLTFTLALFALALAGLWATGQTQSIILNGIVPLFDAADYYTDALRLQAGQDFSEFSARRPLFAGFLSVLLWLTGRDLMATLALLTLITAVACYIAAQEICATHGPEVAVFVLIILFLFYRHHSGTVMSENLGVPLGTLGFALMWRGTAHRKSALVWFGLFVTTLALNARAGAFFTLPFLLLWGGWMFREAGKKYSLRFLIIGSTIVFSSFAVNLILVRLLASPTGVPFSNFSYTLYGLASGGNSWHYVLEMHPELLALSEPEQSRIVYQMAFDLIQQEPGLMIRGALFNWSMLFSDSWYSAYSFVGGENRILRNISQWGIFALCLLGLLRWLRKLDDPLTGLMGLSVVGVLISVPFLPPTDAFRMRPYAASMIIFGLLPALGLLFGMETLKLRSASKLDPEYAKPGGLIAFTILLVSAVLLGPLVVKSLGNLPRFEQVVCAPGLDSISVRFDRSTSFNILRQNQPGLDWMPDFHIGRFRRNAHSLPDPNMIAWAEDLDPLRSLFYTLDYRSAEKVLVVAPTALLPSPNSLWQVCGEWEDEPNLKVYNIYYAREEATYLSPFRSKSYIFWFKLLSEAKSYVSLPRYPPHLCHRDLLPAPDGLPCPSWNYRKQAEPQAHPHRYGTDLCPVLADVYRRAHFALAGGTGPAGDHGAICTGRDGYHQG